MAKVTLKTYIEGRYGASRIIAGNTISFDSEGFTEVDEDVAELLLQGEYDLRLHSGDIPQKKEGSGVDSEIVAELELKLKEAQETIVTLEKEIKELKEAADIRSLLKGKSKEELQEFCKEAGYPEEEWINIKKIGELRDYMVSQETKEE